MKLKKWEAALIAAVLITALCGFVFAGEADALSDKLIRLHVVANSDSDEDQSLKLQVRDEVLKELSTILEGTADKTEAAEILRENLDAIDETAERSIRKQGKSYPVTVTLCSESFPTTQYDTFSLPAGEYTSLRIVIGEGEGHNWWCVVFPPVCASASVEDMTTAAVGLTDGEVKLITSATEGYAVKFKTMELIAKLRKLFA